MLGHMTPKQAKTKKSFRLPFLNAKPVGLGDVVSKVTKAIGFSECAMCRKRKAKLNKMMTIGGRR